MRGERAIRTVVGMEQTVGRSDGLTVGEVARISGLTVRTLHHYDETGLLSPSARTRAGHRRYGEQELLRLRQMLIRCILISAMLLVSHG